MYAEANHHLVPASDLHYSGEPGERQCNKRHYSQPAGKPTRQAVTGPDSLGGGTLLDGLVVLLVHLGELAIAMNC